MNAIVSQILFSVSASGFTSGDTVTHAQQQNSIMEVLDVAQSVTSFISLYEPTTYVCWNMVC